MNTVCALPGCSHMLPDAQSASTDGYCDTHINVAILEAITNLTGYVERLTREVEDAAQRRDARDG